MKNLAILSSRFYSLYMNNLLTPKLDLVFQMLFTKDDDLLTEDMTLHLFELPVFDKQRRETDKITKLE